MESINKTLLIKNILCAVSAGVIVNVGMINNVSANKADNDVINVTADDTSDEMKNIANDIANIDIRLNNISTPNDKKYVDDIDKNEVLINLKAEKIFNPYTKLKYKNSSLEKEDETETINDFATLNQNIADEAKDNEFTKKDDSSNNIKENIEFDIDKDRVSIEDDKVNDDVYSDEKKSAATNENTSDKETHIEKNSTVAMENKNNILTLTDENQEILHRQAVEDARKGLYDKALPALQSLYANDKNNTAVAFDYMTVLNWAGKYKEAVQLYENGQYENVPDWVKLNIAGAYYHLNLFDNTISTLKSFTEKNNKEASLLLAQAYLKTSDTKEADDIYNDLLIKYPNDMEIYLNRAQTSISVFDWTRAIRDWNDVLNLYEKNPNDTLITKQQILDNLSAAYIRISRFKEAEDLLKPYVDNKTASPNMVGNYITVLNNTNRFKQAEKVYDDFFVNYDSAPVFVTRELADSYIRDKNYKKAVNIYEHLIPLSNDNIDDKFNLAYYACLSGVEKYKGIQSYQDILADKNASRYTMKILNQAQEFLRKGYYNTAKSIYYELIKYDKRFHNIYAEDLVKERQYQSALHEYYAMTEDKDLKKQGIDGIVQTSVLLNDYKTAEDRLKQLDREFKNISYDKAKGSFTNKQMGEIEFNASNYSDYDDSNETDVNVFVKQYIDNGFWIEGSVGKSYIKDVEDNKTTVLDTSKVGLRYTARKWDALLAWNMFGMDSGDKNGLYFETLFRPTDRQSVNFIYSYEPIYDVNALNYEGGSIFGDNYILRYIYNLNTQESYYLELRRSKYTDDNNKYGWEVGQQYNIYNNTKKEGRSLERTIFWSRDRYSNQDVEYTSPKLSENIGSEWRWGLDLGHDDTLYYILGANWKRDYPEKLAFSPYIGIEYNKSINDYNFYSISAGYGWRSQSWIGEGDWDYDNKQISFSYNITW